MLTHLSLFSGIGGIDIAAEWAGFTTIGQCEFADYPYKVLQKHWPDVPKWRDIRDLTGGDFYEQTGHKTVDIISGGFPCQPFSVAGKRRGKADDRYLWPEMCRVISEIRPAWVLGENVPGIVNLALDQVLADLEGQGYTCQTFNIPACGVDAPHKRARIAIVAYSGSRRCSGTWNVCDIRELQKRTPGERQTDQLEQSSKVFADVSYPNAVRRDVWRLGRKRIQRPDAPCNETDSGCEDVANTKSAGFQGHDNTSTIPSEKRRKGQPFATNRERNVKQWWPAEPDVGRGFDGLSAILDGIGGLSDAAKNRACEILCDVRESFTPEAVQRAFGGFQSISAEEILLAFLCEYEESCFRSGTTETSGAAPEGLLRGLWRTVESARASYRREYHSQLAREYSDALLRLSHGAPSLMPQAWANGTWEDGIERATHGIKSRVDRIKCLGNAVVPQQVYPILQAIATIEEVV
jgi:DNA (cytosine-5)-methyltransferase 1